MRLVSLNKLAGGERLARPIMTDSYQELLAAGTELKPEYIEKIKQLGINEVMIDDGKLSPEQVLILRDEVETKIKTEVREILERHIYSNTEELRELSKTADLIITEILSNDEVIEQIYDISERSADIYEHSINVCSLSILVAAKLGSAKEDIHDLGVACIFHDIGLRYLDFKYTNIRMEEFGPKEVIEYRKHPVYGYAALEKEDWLSDKSKVMILQHHERLDGTGFPIHPKDMMQESKILQTVDAFDEMICGIGCERCKVYEAVEYLKIFRGVRYSDKIVETLLEFTAVFPAGTVVKLSNGEGGIVIRQNKQFPERPIIKITTDRSGQPCRGEKIVNLLDERSVFINEVLS